MPIKFRCQHCRQFLGISRARAGQVVDCPSCGLSVRVPNLDGSIDPLTEPKLNVSELAGALNELARIGEEGDEAETLDPQAMQPQAIEVKELAPLPRPEPIIVEPAEPAIPVDIHESPRDRETVASWTEPVSPAFAASPAKPSFGSMLKSAPVLALLVLTAAAAFGGGWFAGGMGGDESPAPAATGTANGEKPAAPAKPSKRRAVYHPDDWKPAISGQVTFLENDQSHADAGARVIVLPTERGGGQSKVPVAGFWPQSDDGDDADFRVSLAALRELGGDAALVDGQGRFEISLPPSAGKYHILVVSANQSTTFDTYIPADTHSLLARYFDRPNGLIKKLAYKHATLSLSGGAPQTWNHTFED